MSQGPRRLIEDPEWGVAFEGLLDEQGTIEGLPDNVRADVATMVAASVAGAVGVAVAGAAASAGGSAGATGAVSSVAGSGSVSAAAATGTAASGTIVSGTVVAGTVAGAGAGVSSAVGASVVGGLGAASASLAALGLAPKVIAVLSLAGALTAGGVAVVKSTQAQSSTTKTTIVSSEAQLEGLADDTAPSGGKTKLIEQGREQEAVESLRVEETEEVASESEEGGLKKDVATATLQDEPSLQPARPQTNVASGLAGEVSLLRRARSALSVNREYAWTLLNEYQRRYPDGALRSEYKALVRRAQSAQFDENPAAGDN